MPSLAAVYGDQQGETEVIGQRALLGGGPCLAACKFGKCHGSNSSELVRAWRPRLRYPINNPDPPLPYSDLHMNLHIRRRLRWIFMDASGR